MAGGDVDPPQPREDYGSLCTWEFSVILRAPFFSWIALYAVFIPWSEAGRLLLRYLNRAEPVSIAAARAGPTEHPSAR